MRQDRTSVAHRFEMLNVSLSELAVDAKVPAVHQGRFVPLSSTAKGQLVHLDVLRTGDDI